MTFFKVIISLIKIKIPFICTKLVTKLYPSPTLFLKYSRNHRSLPLAPLILSLISTAQYYISQFTEGIGSLHLLPVFYINYLNLAIKSYLRI